MNKHLWTTQSTPYEADYAQWCAEQGALLRSGQMNALDRDNLAEEIESLGRSEKKEIRSRMRVLLQHLLKWEFQPAQRSHSWQSSISEQRIHIDGVVSDSPNLRAFPAEIVEWAYPLARRSAADETGLPVSVLPVSCPYAIESILDEAHMPGSPWNPDDLIRD